MFDYAYVQGYLAALQDVKYTFQNIDVDMKFHKRKRTAKEYLKIIDKMIEGRSILRENPDVFVRCDNNDDYELFDQRKKEVVK